MDNEKDIVESLNEAHEVNEKEVRGEYTDATYTLSIINGNPGLVIRADHTRELENRMKKALPIFKKLKGAMQEGKKQTQNFDSAQGDNPECPYHNTQMKKVTGTYKNDTQYSKAGDTYSFWSCGTKLDNGEWCNYKPGKGK
ncbi:MAG: hypothetical protein DRP09_11060 [Candidatus Thorarchaeota archaeon]|nr:MAG: hypothetical protein DRP09_11060 [Candidatus Thorarchaeota archaeon]